MQKGNKQQISIIQKRTEAKQKGKKGRKRKVKKGGEWEKVDLSILHLFCFFVLYAMPALPPVLCTARGAYGPNYVLARCKESRCVTISEQIHFAMHHVRFDWTSICRETCRRCWSDGANS